MRVIPVLDVKGGVAVHARGGDRSHYGPLSSVWHPGSADPRALADGYRRKSWFNFPPELYLADLDAIDGAFGPDLELYRDLTDKGLRLWVDGGARRAVECAAWIAAGVEVVVLGLETIEGPGEVGEAVARFGAGRLIFSLDLRDGRPIVDVRGAWGTEEPELIAEVAAAMGIERILVLDLARVGSGRGPGGLDPSRRPAANFDVSVFVGGGVRSWDEIRRLRSEGIVGVMVGTAVHDGTIEPFDLDDWVSAEGCGGGGGPT